jgi:phospholipid transport system substrate-binding protein
MCVPSPLMRETRVSLVCRVAFPLLCLAMAALAGAALGQDNSPTKVVEQFQGVLVSVMSEAKKLGYEGRHKRLAPAVRETHDLAAIAQVAGGRYWERLDDTQKKRLIDTFGALSIATYAYRFDGYSGETFKTISEERLERGDALVRSQLIEPNGDTVRFDFVLRQREGRWRIVNIIVDGVSDLAIKRAEYGAILRDQGFEALIEKLNEKIAQYSGTARPQ